MNLLNKHGEAGLKAHAQGQQNRAMPQGRPSGMPHLLHSNLKATGAYARLCHAAHAVRRDR